MEKELLKKEIIAIINVLPDDDLVLVNQMIKKLILAWDPDFTKLTKAEKEELEHIQNNDEYVSMDWHDVDELNNNI